MSHFKFRFETLLHLRENALNWQRAEFAKALEALTILEDTLKKTQEEIAAATINGREMMQSGKIDIQYLLGLRRHESYLQGVVGQTKMQIESVSEEVEKRRQAVMEANRKKKALEMLKEKQQSRAAADEQRAEMKQMDETASIRTARNMMEALNDA
ncbi:MAG: flagellar export protein FliJ [Planctomycetaceae bacterium]|jgi:flagellar export protein FliJ|nr:flagellar export protein FliJ [Planctomycetaceae bacterium]